MAGLFGFLFPGNLFSSRIEKIVRDVEPENFGCRDIHNFIYIGHGSAFGDIFFYLGSVESDCLLWVVDISYNVIIVVRNYCL